MGEKEWVPSDLLDVFGDELARKILVLASDRPVSADDLATELDASKPTIYRRVNALIDYDLLRGRQELDIKGNHYRSYETTLHHVTFEINDGGYDISLSMRKSLVDQFESFWTDLEGAASESPLDTDAAPHHDSTET